MWSSIMLTVKKTFTLCYIKNIGICIKKDEELKGDNITVENEGNVEYGNDFLNCKIIHSKQ